MIEEEIKITCSKCHSIPVLKVDSSFKEVNIECTKCPSLVKTKEEITSLIKPKYPFTTPFTPECSNFQYNKCKFKAKKLCLNCNKQLCQECLDYHKKVFFEHTLVTPDKNLMKMCNNHVLKEKNFYCFQCKKEICELCIQDDKAHTKHSIANLKNLIDDGFIEKFETNINECYIKIQKVSEIVQETISQNKILIENLKEENIKFEKLYNDYKNKNNNLLEFEKILVNNYKKLCGNINYNSIFNLINHSFFNLGILTKEEEHATEKQSQTSFSSESFDESSESVTSSVKNIDSFDKWKKSLFYFLENDAIIRIDDSYDFMEFSSTPLVKTNAKYIKASLNNNYFYINPKYSIFNAKEGGLLIAYGEDNNIDVIDLVLKKMKYAKKGAHKKKVIFCRHFLDTLSNRDSLISSGEDLTIKIWEDITLTKITFVAESKFICYSADMILENNQYYLIGSFSNSELKIYEYSKKISNSQNLNNFLDPNICNTNSDTSNTIIKNILCDADVFCLQTYADKKNKSNYFIYGTCFSVFSYLFSQLNKPYKYYSESRKLLMNKANKYCIKIYMWNNCLSIIESDSEGNVRIWDFHNAKLLKKITCDNICLYGICIWNDEFILAGCSKGKISMINIITGKIKYLENICKRDILNCNKIIHPLYGEAIIVNTFTQDLVILISENNSNE